ncbi:3'-5' exonuclease domain-containing protein 2 [Xenophilus arseniciresistens]|uniref:3'-5' exonuclease n=1 Tax=Xenophilus arseniciresistens TaxID=1283306 RepID=A0AAE3N4N4_9BURK|nr:3'-5' exonuclease [Xenophilus arseniciresistens]MDA7415770.1 3'-5' exonuclease domain-containing protein 2 [Xenophilus arseniciresistens]
MSANPPPPTPRPSRAAERPRPPRPQPPSREQIAALPPFAPLPLAHIHRVNSAQAAAQAAGQIRRHAWLGFDTESKPTFHKDERSTGPHTLQLASADAAWVFQLHQGDCLALALELLADAALTKVGFGLDGDKRLIRERWGIEPQAVLDLDSAFRRQGYRQSIGVKTAVAIVFGQCFTKSRKQSTTNWATPVLSEGQLRYAANDAWAALRVAQGLGLVPAHDQGGAPPG